MNQTILIADSEEPFLRITECALLPLGASICSVTDGEAVMKAVRTKSVDVILADADLPGLSGVDLCNRLAEDDQFADLPVILLSSKHDYNQRLESLNAGAVDFIVKPFLVAELQARVRTHLRMRQMHQHIVALTERAAGEKRQASMHSFAVGIGHNFNNLLTAGFGFLAMVQDKTTDSENQGYLRNIELALKRMGRLARQLLAFTGELATARQSISMHRLVTNSISIFDPTALRRGIAILCDIGKLSGTTVYGDEFQLTQSILHVLDNARESMAGKRGRITIKGDVERQTAVLRITDEGVGMSEEVLGQICQPFFTTKQNVGCGLGLSMCAGILRELGGDIHLTSEVGKGTTVELRLPLSEEGQSTLSVVDSAFVTNIQVLVAVDAAETSEALQAVLVANGFTVDAVDTQQALFQRLEKHSDRYSAVLLDLLRGELYGDPLMIQIRKYTDAPIVYSISTDHQAPSSNANLQILRKPFRPDDLLEALRKFPSLVQYG